MAGLEDFTLPLTTLFRPAAKRPSAERVKPRLSGPVFSPSALGSTVCSPADVTDTRVRRPVATEYTYASVTSAGEQRSEEHTSELQSQSNPVCRLLLEKKK